MVSDVTQALDPDTLTAALQLCLGGKELHTKVRAVWLAAQRKNTTLSLFYELKNVQHIETKQPSSDSENIFHSKICCY